MLKLNFFPILIIAFVVNYSQQDNQQLYEIKCNGCQATKPVQNFDLNRVKTLLTINFKDSIISNYNKYFI